MQTALRCPMCGTMNPVGNVDCEKCQARLIPLAAPQYGEPEREQGPIREPAPPVGPPEEMGAQPVDERAPGAEPEEPEAGDWLAQLRASAAQETVEPDVIEEPIEPAEIPDWLRDMGPVSLETRTEPEKRRPLAEPGLEEQTPAGPPPTVDQVTERPQELEPAEVPDWLREIAPPEMATPQFAPPAAELAPEEAIPPVLPPVGTEIPDWLREIAPPEMAAPEAAPPVLPPVEAEIPDWLREIAPPEIAAPEAAPPAAGPEPEEAAPPVLPPLEAEVPDWLREIAPPEAAPPPSPVVGMPEGLAEAPAEAPPAVPPLTEPPTEAGITEVPEWLAELKAEPAPPATPSAPVFGYIAPSTPGEAKMEIAAAGGLAPAAIPDWLEALRPRPEAALTAIEEEPAEMEGLLEGLRGVLSPVPAFGAPTVRDQAPPSATSEASLARAQLLQSLLARPAKAPQSQAHKRGVGTGERLQRWLVTVVLLMATGSVLIAPLIGIDLPTLTQSTTPSGVIRSYNAVQGLSAGDPVLVAFEYGPAEADELNLVGEPVLRHLVERGAQMSIVSTQPENQAVAEGLLGVIAAPLDQYTYSYRPGDATGVSQLLTDAPVQPKMILVLTARPGPLRWWVEQTQARYGDTIPVVVGMSAALESAASPYQDTRAGQMEGAIYGLSGAAGYETLLGSPEQITGQLNALALGHLAIVGLMILGALFYTPGGLQGRKK